MGSSGRRLTLTLVAVFVVCLLVGGGASYVIGRQHRMTAEPATQSEPATSGGTADPVPGSGSRSPSAAGTNADQPSVSRPPTTDPRVSEPPSVTSSAPEPTDAPTSSSELPPLSPSKDVSVQLLPQAQQSTYAEEVRQLLQRYFDAINTKDYKVWASAVSAAQSKSRPEAEWQTAYGSTLDSQIRVISIADDSLQVRLWFVSQQDVKLAPATMRVPCISWDVTYQLVQEQGMLLVGNSVTSPTMVACS